MGILVQVQVPEKCTVQTGNYFNINELNKTDILHISIWKKSFNLTLNTVVQSDCYLNFRQTFDSMKQYMYVRLLKDQKVIQQITTLIFFKMQ